MIYAAVGGVLFCGTVVTAALWIAAIWLTIKLRRGRNGYKRYKKTVTKNRTP